MTASEIENQILTLRDGEQVALPGVRICRGVLADGRPRWHVTADRPGTSSDHRTAHGAAARARRYYDQECD